MAKYSDLRSIITAQFAKTNRVAYLVLGKPGGGKSALSMDIARSIDPTGDNTVVFTPSLRDPVDVLGTPRNDGEMTRWVPPTEFYKLRHVPGDTTPKFLIIEELTDASMPMMNAMCRIVLDRMAGDLRLSDNLFIIGTGNRTEDKSGANRLSTKLGNRLNVQEFDENLDDWVDWAISKNVDPVLVQFIRFKPNLLSDFDPNRPYGINPTPRQWEAVNHCATNINTGLYMQNIQGLVGAGAAAEYAAFRKIHSELVSFEDVIMHPDKVEVPKDLSAQYALVGSISANTNKNNVDRVAIFVERLKPDFAVMYWNDTIKRTPEVKISKSFVKWVTSKNNVITN